MIFKASSFILATALVASFNLISTSSLASCDGDFEGDAFLVNKVDQKDLLCSVMNYKTNKLQEVPAKVSTTRLRCMNPDQTKSNIVKAQVLIKFPEGDRTLKLNTVNYSVSDKYELELDTAQSDEPFFCRFKDKNQKVISDDEDQEELELERIQPLMGKALFSRVCVNPKSKAPKVLIEDEDDLEALEAQANAARSVIPSVKDVIQEKQKNGKDGFNDVLEVIMACGMLTTIESELNEVGSCPIYDKKNIDISKSIEECKELQDTSEEEE
jgi:hypothetical protein